MKQDLVEDTMEDPTYVKASSLKLGPKGLGDPDDNSLRRVETEVKIPQKVREKARAMKCVDEVKAFNDCALANGVSLIFFCRKQNNVMKDCLAKWYNDKTFWNECTQEYLQERAEYRRTGVPVQVYQRVHH